MGSEAGAGGDPLAARNGGVLLHPTSLPGPGYIGDFGTQARRFVDLAADAGLRIWQVLPLGPTHSDGCPYQSFSAHAGNPELIDLDALVGQGWLGKEDARAGLADSGAKRQALDRAFDGFSEQLRREPDAEIACYYRQFRRQSGHWLEDYVRFRAFREAEGGAPWTAWPAGLGRCEPEACERRALELAPAIERERFCQFVFDCQWRSLRSYANSRGLALFGDMPIYVHLESADVWAHQDLFDLDPDGYPVTVTGVPPDYFSEEGQLWGNPQYHWQRMRDSGFTWWLQRFASAAHQFDILRIDHFRALEAYWEIPASALSAKEGRWVQAPGAELLGAVRRVHPELRLVAENLGTISNEVEALRREFDLPGMLILQFAFDGSPDNPYLSHCHSSEDIVYTGTHDNDTTLGWFESLDDDTRRRVYEYFGNPEEPMPRMLVRRAMASAANTAIVPWQDFLGLDGAHRMNTPGTTEGNWRWRFGWDQVPAELPAQIHQQLSEHGRLVG